MESHHLNHLNHPKLLKYLLLKYLLKKNMMKWKRIYRPLDLHLWYPHLEDVEEEDPQHVTQCKVDIVQGHKQDPRYLLQQLQQYEEIILGGKELGVQDFVQWFVHVMYITDHQHLGLKCELPQAIQSIQELSIGIMTQPLIT